MILHVPGCLNQVPILSAHAFARISDASYALLRACAFALRQCHKSFHGVWFRISGFKVELFSVRVGCFGLGFRSLGFRDPNSIEAA